MTQSQRIILPWETKKWQELRPKISEPINSIVDLDSRIASIYAGRVPSRCVIELFQIYYLDDTYAKDRLPENVIIKQLIPMLQKLIYEAPKLFREFKPRILAPGRPQNIVLTRPQVAALIACSLFGLFEYTYLTNGKYNIEDFPEFSFVNIFLNRNIFALQCLLNYFLRVHNYITSGENTINEFNASNIIIYRKSLTVPPDWAASEMPISEISIGEDGNQPGKIDDSPAKIHVDFANEFLGGTSFNGILSQEEILFLVRPECLVAMLFCRKLSPIEAVCIYGAEKISQYVGYASNVKFAGNYNDQSPRSYSADNTETMIQHVIICIDATSKTSGVAQYIEEFDRDLNKAYCGFSTPPGKEIATGNWGRGYYGGLMPLKFLQQVLAASQAGHPLIYYPFVKDFEAKLMLFIDWIQRNKLTVGRLYILYKQLMKKYYRGPNSRLSDLDLFDALIDQ